MSQLQSRSFDLAMLGLRVGLGCFFLRPGWAKVTAVSGVIGLWQRLHLPLPAVFGPIHAVVEFGGAILLFPGLLTRWIGLLLSVDMAGALLLVKLQRPPFFGQEWLALWVGLALLAVGAGAFSVDALLRQRRARGSG